MTVLTVEMKKFVRVFAGARGEIDELVNAADVWGCERGEREVEVDGPSVVDDVGGG